MPRFSSRTSGDRTANEWARVAARVRGSAGAVDLTVSNPMAAGIPYPEALRAATRSPEPWTYAPKPLGLRVARDAIGSECERDGMGIDPDRVVVLSSTSEGYALLFKLLCDPGDSVLIPTPSYPLFDTLARLEGVHAVPYRLTYDGAWHVDFDSLRSSLTKATRAIVVVSPNNPTGSYLKREELARIAELGLPIISDEVFAQYPLVEEGTRARTALEQNSVLTFCLDGLSKRAGLPQLKISWGLVGGPATEVEEALGRLEVIADTFLSVATPTQERLPRILEHSRAVRSAIHERVVENLATLTRLAADTALTVLRPEGGWYAVMRLPATRTEDEWLDALAGRGVLVQPGWLYDFDRTPRMVLSLLAEPAVLERGVSTLVATAGEG